MLQRIFIAVVIFASLYMLLRFNRIGQMRAAQRAAKAMQPHDSICILYFSAEACQQCRGQEQILDDVMNKLEANNVGLQKYPVEQYPELARQWGVKTVPTTVIVGPDGAVFDVKSGLISTQYLLEQLQK